ncbi:MAG: tRNA (adenosine(37)-N6)-dimethylallyltransferase MiaA [Cytophagaceae bacterium]|nr:tRNA (adenosine(37)-N6)-dimethylallyltransferase MiaA [Gemmatimonadaceae bacterium]
MIAGPTGAGKSAVAMRLAASAPVTIISADSRQVYRHFDIGTAKPTPAERAAVPHALIDMVDPAERISAARWADAATVAIDAARAVGRIPLVVGGTGLYLRALFDPLFKEPPLDAQARAVLGRELAERDTEDLRQEVKAVDPARAHLGRTQLLRAIEMVRLTGETITSWHARVPRETRFTPAYLIVDPGPSLAARLAARTDAMLAAGWVEEVRNLVTSVPEEAPAWNATGYDAVRQVVRGGLTLEAAHERVVIRTRQYAKRQRTWFRHQLDAASVTRVAPDEADSNDRVQQWWRAQEHT